MRRTALSRPLQLALLHEIATPARSYLDYGCGRGDDLAELEERGFTATGWDPYYRPDGAKVPSDIVNLGFVVNVIEDPVERAEVVRSAWTLTKEALVVSARLEADRDEAHVAQMRDGWITRHGTFQKFFTHEELGAWLESVLGESPVPAGLGVFYVFRSAANREVYLASRFRRRVTLPRRRSADRMFEEHSELLTPLVEFVGARGRLPEGDELPDAAADIETVFGSMRRAFRVVALVTSGEEWEHIRSERRVDLLVHLALARFHGRPRWSDLGRAMQRDVRAFFSNYKAACREADDLLFTVGRPESIASAMRESSIGKQTGNGLYVHVAGLSDLPAALRIYEGCARALLGTVEDATLVKLHREEPRISYLAYPDFDSAAHPTLARSVLCDLREQRIRVTRYDTRSNRPILHRKELLVPPSYPRRDVFARLTAREEKLGLYDDPEYIGLEEGWLEVCRSHGIAFKGHSIRRYS